MNNVKCCLMNVKSSFLRRIFQRAYIAVGPLITLIGIIGLSYFPVSEHGLCCVNASDKITYLVPTKQLTNGPSNVYHVTITRDPARRVIPNIVRSERNRWQQDLF